MVIKRSFRAIPSLVEVYSALWSLKEIKFNTANEFWKQLRSYVATEAESYISHNRKSYQYLQYVNLERVKQKLIKKFNWTLSLGKIFFANKITRFNIFMNL